MTRPALSAFILYFNKPSMTARCWGSAQTAARALPQVVDLFVVDNGSAEASKFRPGPDAPRAVEIPLNLGFAAGMNAGLKKAFENPETRLAAALSNDVELDPGFFRNLETLLSSAEEPLIFCPTAKHLMNRSQIAFRKGRVDPESLALAHSKEECSGPIAFPYYYPAAVTVWTRAAFERLGGFDERYFCYWEDVDLSLRAARTGVRLEPRPELVVYHLGRGTTGGKRAYSQHFEKGRLLFESVLRSTRYGE